MTHVLPWKHCHTNASMGQPLPKSAARVRQDGIVQPPAVTPLCLAGPLNPGAQPIAPTKNRVHRRLKTANNRIEVSQAGSESRCQARSQAASCLPGSRACRLPRTEIGSTQPTGSCWVWVACCIEFKNGPSQYASMAPLRAPHPAVDGDTLLFAAHRAASLPGPLSAHGPRH